MRAQHRIEPKMNAGAGSYIFPSIRLNRCHITSMCRRTMTLFITRSPINKRRRNSSAQNMRRIKLAPPRLPLKPSPTISSINNTHLRAPPPSPASSRQSSTRRTPRRRWRLRRPPLPPQAMAVAPPPPLSHHPHQ